MPKWGSRLYNSNRSKLRSAIKLSIIDRKLGEKIAQEPKIEAEKPPPDPVVAQRIERQGYGAPSWLTPILRPAEIVQPERSDRKVRTPETIGIAASEWRECDWELRQGLADGIFPRDELQQYIKRQEIVRAEVYRRHGARSWELRRFDYDLDTSRRMLRAMEDPAMTADAVDYLPKQLERFPVDLRALATELLQLDDKDGVGGIDQRVIDNARSRYYGMPKPKGTEDYKLRKIKELAE